MGNKESKKRISYVKPEALDIGSVASIMGESCVDGEVVSRHDCNPTGNAALTVCQAGNAGPPPT